MNALATTGTSQGNLLAGLTTPVLTANTTLATPAFVNLIGLLLSSPKLVPDTAKILTAKTPVTMVSPAQIADAMIRSMLANQLGNSLGNQAMGSNNSVIAAATANPDPRFVATPNQVVLAAARAATPNTVQAPRKELPGTTGATIVTTVVIAPAPVFVASLPSSATNLAVSSRPLESNTPTPPASTNSLAKISPAGEIAFTAILTPLKEMAVLTTAPETTRQNAAPPQPTASAPSSVPATASASESTTLRGSQSQTESQASIAQATTANGGTEPGTQQGGDTPSQQQQGSSPETPTPPIVSADTKIKSTVVKQDCATQAIVTAATGTLHGLSVTSPGVGPIAFIADQAHAATAMQSDATAATATPFRATAEALRTSEPDMPAAPQLRTGAVQEISIRIAPPDAPPVDLRVVERSGQVHIDVRTPDAGMQTSLRQDLGTLTNSLQRAGYHTETFTPSSSLARATSSAQMSNQDDRQDPSQNRGGSGNFSEGRRQQQQQKRPSTRLGELEDQK